MIFFSPPLKRSFLSKILTRKWTNLPWTCLCVRFVWKRTKWTVSLLPTDLAKHFSVRLQSRITTYFLSYFSKPIIFLAELFQLPLLPCLPLSLHWCLKLKRRVYERGYPSLGTVHRLRVVSFLLSPSCVMRKKTAKKWARELLEERSSFRGLLTPNWAGFRAFIFFLAVSFRITHDGLSGKGLLVLYTGY